MANASSSLLDEKQVRHVAKLARLKLTDADVPRFSQQISSILQYIAQLQQVNTTGFEAMSHPLPLTNVLRDDEVKPSLPVQQVLQNAPSSEGPFFTVPQVLDATLGGG